MSIFLIFTIETLVFSFYNLSIEFNDHFEHFLFFLSFIFSLFYIAGIALLIFILFLVTSEENYFYEVSEKFFFITRGIIKKFPQNKFLPFSLVFYSFYATTMVLAYKNGTTQTILTTIFCALFLIYLISTLPPLSTFYKWFMILIFIAILVVHILFIILSIGRTTNRLNEN